MGDSGGGNLATAATPLHLSSLPRHRLSEWPAKLAAREDGGGGHPRFLRRGPKGGASQSNAGSGPETGGMVPATTSSSRPEGRRRAAKARWGPVRPRQRGDGYGRPAMEE